MRAKKRKQSCSMGHRLKQRRGKGSLACFQGLRKQHRKVPASPVAANCATHSPRDTPPSGAEVRRACKPGSLLHLVPPPYKLTWEARRSSPFSRRASSSSTVASW